MHFMVFSYGKGTEWVILNFVAKMSNIYLECLKILIFFGVNCNSGNEPTYEEKKRGYPLYFSENVFQANLKPVFHIL